MSPLAIALAAGAGGSARAEFGLWCVDVPPTAWRGVVRAAHGQGLAYLDWLGALDEPGDPGTGAVLVVAHLLDPDRRRHLLVRTRLLPPLDLDSVVEVHRGAGWHEREAAEMFGVRFTGHPDPRPLLLHPGAPPTPLRKEYVLAARVARPWPGAVDPTGKERRRAQPPGALPGPPR